MVGNMAIFCHPGSNSRHSTGVMDFLQQYREAERCDCLE